MDRPALAPIGFGIKEEKSVVSSQWSVVGIRAPRSVSFPLRRAPVFLYSDSWLLTSAHHLSLVTRHCNCGDRPWQYQVLHCARDRRRRP